MSILFIGGYQVVPRLLNRFEGLSLAPYARYLFPLPPAWFAGIDSWAAGEQPASGALLGAFGLLTTAALSYIALGKLASSYGEGLTRLSESRSRTSKPAKVRSRPNSIRNPLLRWWLRDPVEQWAFRLAGAYMRRDRDIKLRLYPSLTIFLIFPVMNLLDRNRHGFSAFLPLATVWVLGMLPHQAMQTLQMSQDHLAADIFAIAPLPSAAPVFQGIRKATIYYLLIPSLGVAAILIAWVAPGGSESLILAIPGLLAIPVLSLVPAVTHDYLPLSRPVTRGEQSSRNIGLMFMTMLVMAGVLAVSYLAWESGLIWYLVAIESVVAIGLYQFLNRMIRNRPLVRTYDDLFSYGSEPESK
jgi:hypothetical protein